MAKYTSTYRDWTNMIVQEPGQARRISRSASVLGSQNFGFDLGPHETGNGSQRSSLFPWDNAGPSSSTGNDAFPIIGDEQAVAPVDIRMRSSSLSRHDSPLASSLRGSLVPQMITVGLSPTAAGRNVQIFGEDFAFDGNTNTLNEAVLPGILIEC